jgi:hypothetical protein
MVVIGRPDGQLCDWNPKTFANDLSCLRASFERWWPVVQTVARSLHVISMQRFRASGPGGWSSGQLMRCTQFPYLMLACPDHANWRPGVWIWIAILTLWMSGSGRESMSSRWLQQSSHICVLERNLESWSNTESHPDRLLNRPNGCKLEQFEASRHRERSGRESMSSRRMML